MRGLFIFSLLLLVPGLAEASDMIRCDPTDITVPNRVVEYQQSANTEDAWLTDSTRILNPSTLPAGSRFYWKCSAGSVIAMTQAERDAADAQAIAAQAAFVASTSALKKRLKSLGLTDSQVHDLAGDTTVSIPPVTSITHTIPIMAVGLAATWTNQPVAVTEMYGATRRIKADLSPYVEFRLQVNVAVAGGAGSLLWAQSSPDQTTWTNLDGASGPTVAISTTGLKVTAWTPIPVSAQTDIFLRPMGQNGNGAVDPAFGSVILQVR